MHPQPNIQLPLTAIRCTIGVMSHLWTPWRMPYLQGKEPLPEECLFCHNARLADQQAHIVHRVRLCYVILNRFPYNNGHLMVVPYQHAPSLEHFNRQTLTEMMMLVQRSLRVLQTAYEPEGFNVGMNIGEASGAGIAEHAHMHIVPRWAGDTNYLTTVGKTRTIPEWMDETYDRLRPLFEALGEEGAGAE